MSTPTMGTEVFVYDPDKEEVVNLGCLTNIDGIGAEVNKIDTTCMGDKHKTYAPGQLDPSDVTIEFNFDPGGDIEELLYKLYKGEGIDNDERDLLWSIGLPGDDSEPSESSGELDMSGSRDQIRLYGFISNYELSFDVDEVIEATVTIGATKPFALGDPS